MEESGYVGGMLSGLACFIAGVRLIRLSWRSQKSPELLLGVSFLLWGLSYLCWQIPIATANQPLTQPLFFAGRALTDTAMIVFANFIWIAFRSRASWAKFLVFAIAISEFAGVAGSVGMRDWEGVRPLSNPWWWVDWAAGMVTMVWIGVEGTIHYWNARSRVRLGLCDPLVCNRYLLWGITGIAWTAVWGLGAYQNVGFETQRVWSSAIGRAAGTLDITGVALVLIICFPPRFYQRWIAGASPAPEPEEA